MHKAPKKAHIEQIAPKEAQELENYEILVNYVYMGEKIGSK